MSAVRTKHTPTQRAADEMSDEDKKKLQEADDAAAADDKKDPKDKKEDEGERAALLGSVRSALEGLQKLLGGDAAPQAKPSAPVEPTGDARSKAVAGYRSIAGERGRSKEIEALDADPTATVADYRSIALTAIRTSRDEIDPFSGGSERSTPGQGEKLLTFHEVRAERAKRAKR